MNDLMRAVPGTDLRVHPLGLGGNVFGFNVDEAAGFRILDAFVDAGGNLVDTADSYCGAWTGGPGGESETLIGSWIRSRGSRERIVVSTKVGQLPGRDDLRAPTIIAACEDALRRLGTDHLDLFYAHEDHGDPTDETVAAFESLVTAGKIRYAAASNYGPDRLREALDATTGPGRYVALQPRYNLMDREPFETTLAPLAAAEGLGVFPWFGLAAGFLTGKHPMTGPALDVLRAPYVEEYRTPRGQRVVDALRVVAGRHAVTPAAVALAWLSGRPTVVAPLASVTSTGQLEELLAMTTLRLEPGDEILLDQASAPEPVGAR
ncbi:MAG TPA: aldo/keto reductase [Nocardioides sp.]|nr:aldo/keto reductase [Nocardioides sp.]